MLRTRGTACSTAHGISPISLLYSAVDSTTQQNNRKYNRLIGSNCVPGVPVRCLKNIQRPVAAFSNCWPLTNNLKKPSLNKFSGPSQNLPQASSPSSKRRKMFSSLYWLTRVRFICSSPLKQVVLSGVRTIHNYLPPLCLQLDNSVMEEWVNPISSLAALHAPNYCHLLPSPFRTLPSTTVSRATTESIVSDLLPSPHLRNQRGENARESIPQKLASIVNEIRQLEARN